MKHKTLVLTTAAILAGFLSLGSAQAGNVMSGASTMPAVEKSQDSNMQTASHRKWRKWRGDSWRWRHRRHRHFGGSGIFLGFGLAPFYGGYPYYAQPYYDEPYYIAPAGGSRHVRYCLNRYRTYHIPSNTFRGFDGDRHRCRSPYRY